MVNSLILGTTQYMRWGRIKAGLEEGPNKAIKLWSFYRNSRPVLFLSRETELPYFRNATDLQVLVKHNGERCIPAEIPQIIKDLLLGNLNQQVTPTDFESNEYFLCKFEICNEYMFTGRRKVRHSQQQRPCMGSDWGAAEKNQ